MINTLSEHRHEHYDENLIDEINEEVRQMFLKTEQIKEICENLTNRHNEIKEANHYSGMDFEVDVVSMLFDELLDQYERMSVSDHKDIPGLLRFFLMQSYAMGIAHHKNYKL